MTTDQFNQSVTDSIKNLVNKAKQAEDADIRNTETQYPESFSDWLESNNDSIECCENCTEIDQRMANHDIYKNENPFQ